MSTEAKISPDEPVDRNRLGSEITENYRVFCGLLPQLLLNSKGKFCLMKGGEIIDTFDTISDAFKTAKRLYPDGIYSIQEVTSSPVDLGYFSHAMPCL